MERAKGARRDGRRKSAEARGEVEAFLQGDVREAERDAIPRIPRAPAFDDARDLGDGAVPLTASFEGNDDVFANGGFRVGGDEHSVGRHVEELLSEKTKTIEGDGLALGPQGATADTAAANVHGVLQGRITDYLSPPEEPKKR